MFCLHAWEFLNFMISWFKIQLLHFISTLTFQLKKSCSVEKESSKFASNPTVISNIASFSREIIGRFLFICGK